MNSLIRFLVTSLFVMLTLPAFSQENFPTTKIKQMTEKLAQLATETHPNMTSAESSLIFNLAKERHNIFINALNDYPERLTSFLIPNNMVHALPSSIQPYLENQVTNIEGTLEILMAVPREHATSFNQQEVTRYLLRTAEGKVFNLHFSNGLPQGLKTGVRLRIRTAYLISATHNELLILSKNDCIILTEVTKKAISDAIGPQKTLVFLMSFQDDPTNKPFTLEQINDSVFSTVNNMFNEYSYQQTTLIGNIIDWTTIPINSTDTCDNITDGVVRIADSIATAAGYDLSQYNRRMFVFPTVPNCWWGGLGNVGGTITNAWINGYNIPGLIGHELGHNLGLDHSHSIYCNSTGCETREYGDQADIMGDAYAFPYAHFNAAQKELLGWLGFENSPPIKTITSPGTYTIDAYETKNTNIKALKILKETKEDGSNDYYYIEFRQPIGFDTNLANCPGCSYTAGVLIHSANSVDINQTFLLFPQDLGTTWALLPGKSFNDPKAPNGGLTITLDSISSAGAVVRIEYGTKPPVCIHYAPSISVLPDTTQWTVAGGSARYSITLKNNDNEHCGSSSFDFFVGQTPKTITASFTSKSLVLEPGKAGTLGLKVSTNFKTPSGIYDIKITAKNKIDSSKFATVPASLGVTKR